MCYSADIIDDKGTAPSTGINTELQFCLEHYRQVTLVSFPHKTHHWPCYDCPDERGEWSWWRIRQHNDNGAEETKFPFYKFARSHITTGVQLQRVSECVLEEKDSLKDSYEKVNSTPWEFEALALRKSQSWTRVHYTGLTIAGSSSSWSKGNRRHDVPTSNKIQSNRGIAATRLYAFVDCTWRDCGNTKYRVPVSASMI